MGMSTHVEGFYPPNDHWKKMKAVYDACKEAHVEVPDEVDKFFNWDVPNDSGVRVEEKILREEGAVREYESDSVSGYEIDLDILRRVFPKMKLVRVFNSW